MAVCFKVIGREALLPTGMLEDEKYLPVRVWCGVKIMHRLVPNRHLRARHVAAVRPGVRLAFDQDRRALAAEIEAMRLFGLADTDRHREILGQDNALLV